jgi:hypothetical protein
MRVHFDDYPVSKDALIRRSRRYWWSWFLETGLLRKLLGLFGGAR